MPSSTRGPLPSGVYWRRRLAVLSVGLILVLALGKLLTNGSDGQGGSGSASQAGATTRTSFPPPDQTSRASSTARASGQGGSQGNGQGTGKGKHRTSSPTPTPTPTPTPIVTPTLADPSGPCADDDVYITPTVASPVLGGSIVITLNLQTQSSEACTWQVSPKTVTMKITSGSDTIWTSQECPQVIPTQDVVVRRAVATAVDVTWNAKRSDEYCTGRTAYALPGTYHFYAAPLAGEPTDVQVDLVAPLPAQVTQTVTPTPTATPTATPTTGSGKHKHRHKND